MNPYENRVILGLLKKKDELKRKKIELMTKMVTKMNEMEATMKLEKTSLNELNKRKNREKLLVIGLILSWMNIILLFVVIACKRY